MTTSIASIGQSRWTASLVIFASITLLTAILQYFDAFAAFDRATLDMQYRAHLDDDWIDKRILILAVDQRSIDHFDRDNVPFPWPRSLYNPVIDFASQHGAKAVIFDILFNNSTPFGPDVDQEFADAIKQSGLVHLATTMSRQTPSMPERLPGFKRSGTPPDYALRIGASLPIEPIYSAAAAVGFVSQKPDPDGIFRRVLPMVDFQGQAIPSLGLSALLEKGDAIHWVEDGSLLIGKWSLPLDDQGQVQLNFTSAKPFRRISILDVIQSSVQEEDQQKPLIDPALFKDAYVFIAYTAPGLFDLKPTPVKEITPGVEVHALLLANTLDGEFMLRVAPVYEWALGAMIALIAIFLTLWVQRLAISSMALILLIASLLAATQVSFALGHWWSLPMLFFYFLGSLIFAAGYRYQFEGRQRRYLQSAFSHYVSPQVVEQITRSPDALALGGQKREITLLFSDLAGFTTLSEQLEPQELVSVLNGYTTLMANTITELHGTVDKYIGDAVMAFWGAPLDQPRQAELAVQAAITCLERFDTFARERFPELELGVRIGIDRGDCIVGNMGSEDRFDYTAIGDTVNQAARLEGLNKAYGSRMLMGENAWKTLDGKFVGRQIDYLKVKGKNRATHVYEVFNRVELASKADVERCRLYEAGFAAYQRQDWDQAEEWFNQVAERYADVPAKTLLKRIAEYRQHPLADDWDGSFAHHSK